MPDLRELLEEYADKEKLYRTEGRKGLENLCQICRAIGYKDPQYFGQLTRNASIGDLINFLEDNSGAIEAIVSWIGDQDITEWKDNVQKQLQGEE